MMSAQFTSLDTSGFVAVEQSISNNITLFNAQVQKMRRTSTNLLSTWQGKGRNEFETQMTLMISKLDDISEDLYDMYNALVKAEKEYIDADQATAKNMMINGKNGCGGR